MKRLLIAATFTLLFPLAAALATSPPESGWESVDKAFGNPGKDQPGDVRRYGWPRTDLHVHGKGDATALAKTLKSALQKTKTPLAPPAGKAPPKPTPAQEAVFQKIQDVLGRKGTMAGTVLQLGIPRAEPIQDGGMEVPP